MITSEYDNEHFFNEYAKMARSQQGLAGAGEWNQQSCCSCRSRARVLDLGCGYGWHCKFASELGASQLLGIDAAGQDRCYK